MYRGERSCLGKCHPFSELLNVIFVCVQQECVCVCVCLFVCSRVLFRLRSSRTVRLSLSLSLSLYFLDSQHRYLNMNLQCKPQVLVDTTDYQFDILRFVYNGLYELEIREMESSASHAHKGQSFVHLIVSCLSFLSVSSCTYFLP